MIKRLRQIGWVPHHLDDIEVDLHTFHADLLARYGSMRAIPSRLFLKIAYTLPRREGTWLNTIAKIQEHEAEEAKKNPGKAAAKAARENGDASKPSPREEMLAERARRRGR